MKEIVTFTLSGKEYGVEVGKLQGIENYADMLQVQDMPEGIQGTITVRKETIPVFDIKKQLMLPAVGVTPDTKYVVLRTTQGKLAVVVDGVSKIVKAEGQEMQNFPVLLQTDATSYVDFIVKKENQLILTINPENLIERDKWKEINKALKKMETGGSND